MILPTAYLPPLSYFQTLESEPCTIEVMESFTKQTFRNRARIANHILLTVPVKKVETHQLTRDVEISYLTHWQHQHWQALKSEYGLTPYYDYYADILRPWYETQTRFLIDLNTALTQTILGLIHNRPFTPATVPSMARTTDWSTLQWTDTHPWQSQTSILDALFEQGPTIKI